jgi:phosphatidylethanolamine-binding protein (PEBP) family uncharacterized protein
LCRGRARRCTSFLIRGLGGTKGARGEPIKGHGPHRYVFQMFALSAPITSTGSGTAPEAAKPRDVLAAAPGPALARGRLDGLYTR